MNRCILLLLLFFAACHSRGAGLPSLDGYREATPVQLQQVEKYLAAKAEKVKSFRGMYKVKVKRTLGSESLKQVLVFNKPEQLRVGFYGGSMNTLMGLVLANQGVVKAIDMQGKNIYFAASGVQTLDSFIGIPLDLPEAMLMFIGQLYIDNAAIIEERQLYFSTDDTHTMLRLEYIDGRELIAKLNPLLGLEEIHVSNSSGELMLRVDYHYLDGDMPIEIDFELIEKGLTIRAEVEEASVNTSKPRDKLFEFKAPPDFSVEQVDPKNFSGFLY